jgi:hypothetical protein
MIILNLILLNGERAMQIDKVMDRKKVAETIGKVLDAGIELLGKDHFSPDDHAKIKVIRTMGGHVNAAVSMIQQETAQQRIALVAERMRQLGYGIPKQLEEESSSQTKGGGFY